jgi:predicted RNA-binding protein YlqC (UPF0109 family)
MPKTTNLSVREELASPDYIGLVKYLLQPFLDVPNSLVVDCEQLQHTPKIWLRVAFEGSDRGKVFGRGGRNIHAIRSVLATAATAAGQSLYLDIYGTGDESKSSREPGRDRDSDSDRSDRGSNDRGRQGPRKGQFRRSSNGKPSTKPRLD